MYCVVKNCKSVWNPNSSIKFHSFSKDVKRLNLWLSIVPLKGKFYMTATICSLHFKQNDYDPNIPGHLLKSAEPSWLPQSCDCVSSLPKASIVCPSTSTAHQNICSASVSNITSIEVSKYESKENFLFTALTSPKTTLSHQLSQQSSSQPNFVMDVESEPPTKRPRLRDFNVQVNIKTPREITLEKGKKVLQQKVARQQQKINSMQKLIKILCT